MEDTLIDNGITENGIINIIYQYTCGISYNKLSKIINKHINSLNVKNVIEYFIEILQKSKRYEDKHFIKINLKTLNRKIQNRRNTLKSLFNHQIKSTDNIVNIVNEIFIEIKKINQNIYIIEYYANK